MSLQLKAANNKASRTISVNEYRLHSLCSERHYFSEGKEIIGDLKLIALEKAFEYILVQELDGYPFKEKTESEIFNRSLTWLSSKKKLLPDEYRDVSLNGAIIFYEFLREITLKNYTPISGPLDIVRHIKKNNILVHLSGIAITPLGGYRSWAFSPYSSERDVLLDPIHHLQFEALNDLSAKENDDLNRPAPILYVVYLNKKCRITSIDKNMLRPSMKNELLVRDNMIYNNIHFPLVPCAHIEKCPYKKECKLR